MVNDWKYDSDWYLYKKTATSSGTSIAWDTYPTSTTIYDVTDAMVSRVEYVETIPDKMPAGERKMVMPDGAVLHIDDKGNYRIDDTDAEVIYQANRVRDFSPHLNASDMLADFVGFVGSIGVHRNDVLNLPIHLFISWLIIEAAERDGDEVTVPRIELAPEIRESKKPRCLCCGRFVPLIHKRARFPYCNPEHARQYLLTLAS